MRRGGDCAQRFRERYSLPVVGAALLVEQQAIGGNFGANGYTTLRQAEMLIKKLDLSSDKKLLDAGSGRGWPALYLAQLTGCEAMLADLPEPALAEAIRRADADGLSSKVSVLRASAVHMPFKQRSFDVVTHTDTL